LEAGVVSSEEVAECAVFCSHGTTFPSGDEQ
jgi:hypothetical protein